MTTGRRFKEIINYSDGSDLVGMRFSCTLTAQKPNEDPSHIGKESDDDQGDDPGSPYIGSLRVEGNLGHQNLTKEGSIIWNRKRQEYIAESLILRTRQMMMIQDRKRRYHMPES